MALIFTGAYGSGCAAPIRLRTDGHTRVCISSGDPDPSASVIRRSSLTAIAKARATEILREARSGLVMPAEEVSIAGDEGLIMDFYGLQSRELMITVAATGSWTYFSAIEDGKQIAAGILGDDGIKLAIGWVAGRHKALVGPGIIAG